MREKIGNGIYKIPLWKLLYSQHFHIKDLMNIDEQPRHISIWLKHHPELCQHLGYELRQFVRDLIPEDTTPGDLKTILFMAKCLDDTEGTKNAIDMDVDTLYDIFRLAVQYQRGSERHGYEWLFVRQGRHVLRQFIQDLTSEEFASFVRDLQYHNNYHHETFNDLIIKERSAPDIAYAIEVLQNPHEVALFMRRVFELCYPDKIARIVQKKIVEIAEEYNEHGRPYRPTKFRGTFNPLANMTLDYDPKKGAKVIAKLYRMRVLSFDRAYTYTAARYRQDLVLKSLTPGQDDRNCEIIVRPLWTDCNRHFIRNANWHVSDFGPTLVRAMYKVGPEVSERALFQLESVLIKKSVYRDRYYDSIVFLEVLRHIPHGKIRMIVREAEQQHRQLASWREDEATNASTSVEDYLHSSVIEEYARAITNESSPNPLKDLAPYPSITDDICTAARAAGLSF